jgi:translation elongation factor EF-G
MNAGPESARHVIFEPQHGSFSHRLWTIDPELARMSRPDEQRRRRVEEVKIHSGTRVKLKHIDEEVLPQDFLLKLKEYAHKEERIQAIYLFAVEPEAKAEQPSMVIALKTGFFSKEDESFLEVVEEVRMMLPGELSLNLYLFGASDTIARYCVDSLEPVYLRATAWLEKQRKKYRR